MVLSKKYIVSIIIGWALLGGTSLLFATTLIGGGAVFFLLSAFASWSLFPLIHFCAAYLFARKHKQDPTLGISLGYVLIVFILLFVILLSGAFNYV